MGLFKKNTRFEFLADKIYNNLKVGRIDLAFAHYNNFESAFKFLDDEKKKKFKAKHEFIKNMLLLYMETGDLIKYASKWDSNEIKEKLDMIMDLRVKTKKMPAALKEIISKKHRKAKRIYNFKITNEEFNLILNEVDKLIDEGNFDFAKEKLKELRHLEQKMGLYLNRRGAKVRKMLDELDKHLDLSYSKSLALSEPAIYTPVKIKKEKKLPELGSKRISSNAFLEAGDLGFSSIRKSIEEGDLRKIEKLRPMLR